MLSTSFDTEEKTHENWNYQENLSNGIQWHILKFSQQQTKQFYLSTPSFPNCKSF